MYYLSAFLKVTVATFYFFYSKNPLNIMKYVFNSISYVLEKNSPC